MATTAPAAPVTAISPASAAAILHLLPGGCPGGSSPMNRIMMRSSGTSTHPRFQIA
jgi:hypothetical protein